MNKTELKNIRERFLSESKMIQKATASSLYKETTAQQEARIKMLLQPKNYTKFFDYYFGRDTPIALGDAPCADFHQSSYQKVWNDPFKFIQRKWYRGSAKSIHGNVGNIAHLKENAEIYFALIVGKTEGQSKILLSDLQAHLEYNERYIKDFGMQMSYGSWSDGEFETRDNRFFKALGINQPFRGLRKYSHRIDFANIDDVEDRKQAKNKLLVKEYGEKITGDLGGAWDFKRGRGVMSNNHIVKDGILDFVKKANKNNPHFEEEIVNLCDGKGNPTWHQRLNNDDVIRIHKRHDYYTLQREFYNNPIEEGKILKEEWIRFVKIHGNKRNWNGVISIWDLSYKKDGDYKAGWFLAFGNGKIHAVEVFCRKCDISEAMKWHYKKMKEYADKGISVISYYDATASQKEVFAPLWRAEAERSGFYSIPMPDHASTDKHMRIEATLTDVLFNKILVFDEKLQDTPDMENALNQILGFEKNMKINDDAPDSLEAGVRKGRVLFSLLTEEGGGHYQPVFTKRDNGGF